MSTPTNISTDEKNIFLQDLEEEQSHDEGTTTVEKTKQHQSTKKGMGATAIFAAFSVLFIFLILLMVFLLSLAGTANPFFQTFGIQPYEIKSFLISLLNKSFLVAIIILLLSTVTGVFRGYSSPKEEQKKRKGSFIFASVAGALIFIALLSWGGAHAFITKTVTEIPHNTNAIKIVDIEKYSDTLVAPIDIGFSIEETLSDVRSRGFTVESIKWSSDGGKNFLEDRDGGEHFFHFTQKGVHNIAVSVLLKNGEEQIFNRSFTIPEATFAIPAKIHAKQKTTLDARELIEGGKLYKWDFDGDGIYDESSSRGLISYIFKKPGIFPVQLRVELAQNGYKIFNREVRVYSESEDSIVAEISSLQEFSGQAPFTMTLSGEESYAEDGEIVQYQWSIGKSRSQKKGKSIEHTFTTPGTQTVTLTVTNDFGEKASTEIEVDITKGNSAPKTEITSLPNAQKGTIKGTVPLSVQFSGEKSTDSDENITEYLWKTESPLGVIEEFSGSDFTYNFKEVGKHSVTLTVSDEQGAQSSKTVSVLTTEPSVLATARMDPEFGSAPLIVDFNASESSCKAEMCSVTGFSWNFNDGSPIKRTGSKISHRFEEPGSYGVELTVHTNTGETNTKTLFVNVSEPAFTSCFSPSRSQGIAPIKVSFNPECSVGEISEYKWDFGDGYISQAKHPNHTFQKPGSYTITLHIINSNGRVSESSKTILIQEEGY